ncbi:hypothetical protein BDM02DRAFT_884534 [Thelephora ganbajun]|uniref:Uncharacterized protein n=1 Tax=Thelephora ganbajun TaxID=370292 RepID=A0ACB6Z524_THEGA|nr:hypothetical protein BDM02DRAFT_884534 [Thelephora ganbajun]
MLQYYDVGSDPHMNTDLSSAIAPPSGPHRSKGGATQKGKEIEKGTRRRKRAPKKALPPDIDWIQTYDRFYWEVIRVYLLQPSGELPTPEAAYAKIREFIKEGLHQSVRTFFLL